MRKSGLSGFVKELEQAGELLRITRPVSTKLEMTEIADRISKLPHGGKALLFEQTGTPYPLLMNSLGSMKRMILAFYGRSPDELTDIITGLFRELIRQPENLSGKLSLLPKLNRITSWLPKQTNRKGSCQEVVHSIPDLYKLPILTCWPGDGGPFITLPLVHTSDPETGTRNVGMYRMQVFSKNETGMHWQVHKTGARHYRSYQKTDRRMPVVVTLGGDPVYTYCAAAPLPDGVDEYLLAGFIRQKPVELVKCLTQDLWVPADSDFVIEGYVDPGEPLRTEGPFGDHTGFYSLEDSYPVFHVTAITHRKDAVYPATVVGIPPQEDAWMAWATEKLFAPAIRLTMIPDLSNLHLPVSGIAHNLALITVGSDYPGQARKVMHAVWGGGQLMFTKYLVAFRNNIDLHNYFTLAKELSDRVDPARHIERGFGPLDVLDHAARTMALGGKIGIDATGELLPDSIRNITDIDLSDAMALRNQNPEITGINLDLTGKGISLGLVSVVKQRKNLCRDLAGEIRLSEELGRIRFWLFFDDGVDLTDPALFTWILGSHTDPEFDVWIYTRAANKSGILFVDATRKNKELDGFERPWPNPVVMSPEIIQKIDTMWPGLNLGKPVSSPSLKYRVLSIGTSAVATP